MDVLCEKIQGFTRLDESSKIEMRREAMIEQVDLNGCNITQRGT